ncbi:hypothetical protein SAMN05421743_103230 [Thalassobacillus cyri]|uniref:Uncharacterized protein n=1 Tax=Thalassobacillus cyri TaxID=571932 RepID=A0A1H3ZGG7_9BACI|nr:hypothetical protein SAMN05421743_103230 [Thalassobacillus cyri]
MRYTLGVVLMAFALGFFPISNTTGAGVLFFQ